MTDWVAAHWCTIDAKIVVVLRRYLDLAAALDGPFISRIGFAITVQ